jgi:hypothetical protein
MFEPLIITSYVITSAAYAIELYNLYEYRENKFTNVVWWAINGIGSILALFYCSANQPIYYINRIMMLFMIQICLSATCLTICMYLTFKDSFMVYNIKEIPLTPQIQNYLDTTNIYPVNPNSNINFINPLYNHSLRKNEENV